MLGKHLHLDWAAMTTHLTLLANTLSLAFAIVLNPCHGQSVPESTEDDWANTGRVDSTAFETKPVVLWKYIGESTLWLGGIAIHDGVLAAIDRTENQVIGIDTETGERTWAVDVGDVFSFGMGVKMTCNSDFDAVIVGCDTGLFALDRKTGEFLWKFEPDCGFGGPTIADDLVVAGGSDGNVYAIKLKTGEEKWKHNYLTDAPEDPPGFVGEQARFPGRLARPMAASTDGETVFLSIFDQCRTLAIDLDSGKRKWAFQTRGWTRSRPTITDEAVFVASQDKRFYAVEKETGKMIWDLESKKWNSTSAAVADSEVVFGSNDGYLYCIARNMGGSLWEFDLSLGGRHKTGIYSRPLIVGGDTVYAASVNGTMHCINLDTGESEWNFKPSADSGITGDLHYDNGKLFLYTRKDDGRGEAAIFAIGQSPEGDDK